MYQKLALSFDGSLSLRSFSGTSEYSTISVTPFLTATIPTGSSSISLVTVLRAA